ncbi:MAG: hypothetical protein U9R19_03300, partial [Bacteroidota bacterium]|nr:hypothetical protein [Bacteroidota bacterium]
YFEYKAYHNVLFNEQIKILFRRVFTLKDPGILWHIAKKFKIRLKRNLGFTPPFKEYANRINGIVEQKYSAIANSSAIFLQSTRSANRYGFANSWKKYFTGNFSYLIFKTSHMGLLNKKSANKIANHLRNLK